MPPSPIEKSLIPPDEHILSVSEFNCGVKNLLENRFPEIWLKGEISNFRRQSSGHCYFSLKDARSQVSAVIFRGDAGSLDLSIRDGLQVIVYGQISVYEPRGSYQIIVRFLVDAGQGRLQLEFERLKRKLAEEGLFDAERKKRVPPLPRTVGFVTSPTGAAVRDFLSILQRRNWRGRVVIFPARVQGKEAAGEIANMIEKAQQMETLDLLVIGRGGGSLEDLWPFNEEKVARAVAACATPIISAVGHEIDYTLSDFAADWRAETPSAAAEFICRSFTECEQRLAAAGNALVSSLKSQVDQLGFDLERLRDNLIHLSPTHKIEQGFLRLDDLTNRLLASLRHGIANGRQREKSLAVRLAAIAPDKRVHFASAQFLSLKNRLTTVVRTRMEGSADRVRVSGNRLHNANPEKILQRGFAIIKDEHGQHVPRKAGLEAGRRLRTQFADGEIGVEVTEA